jgi:hypothetical protein
VPSRTKSRLERLAASTQIALAPPRDHRRPADGRPHPRHRWTRSRFTWKRFRHPWKPRSRP